MRQKEGAIATEGNCKGGSFSLESLDEEVSVNFVLELTNGNIVKGIYKGPFSAVDRKR